VITGGQSLIAFALGVIGFGSYLSGQDGYAGAGLHHRAYYSLQLFVLGAAPNNVST
jgi:hypothetical protein